MVDEMRPLPPGFVRVPFDEEMRSWLGSTRAYHEFGDAHWYWLVAPDLVLSGFWAQVAIGALLELNCRLRLSTGSVTLPYRFWLESIRL